MARSKKYELPKYLRLAKGIMWLDIDGENSSGVRLYRNTETLVGRGNDLIGVTNIPNEDNPYYEKTDKKVYPMHNEDIKNGYDYDVALDKHDNKNSEEGEYGSVENDDKTSWFCTDDIPSEKLGKILTAYQNNILVKHDPKIVLKEYKPATPSKDFGFNKDGDIVFTGTNKSMYSLLMNKSFKDVMAFVEGCGLSAQQNLMDLYQYEVKGFNHLNRPRGDLLDLIRKKLNSFGPSISSVTVGDLDDED